MGEAPDPSDAPRRDPGHQAGSEGEAPADLEGVVEGQGDGRGEAAVDVEGAVEPFDASGDASSMIAHARQRHGLAGGLLAAGLFGVDQAVNGRKVREEAPVVVASNSEPVDVDTDGITVPLDDDSGLEVVAPPQPRTPPHEAPSGKRRRWR